MVFHVLTMKTSASGSSLGGRPVFNKRAFLTDLWIPASKLARCTDPRDPCPCCQRGKVYGLKIPAAIVRLVGPAPTGATVYELDNLRCNLCSEVLTADMPEGAGEEKYDETASGMTALLKYGTGFPFHRLEKLQHGNTSSGIDTVGDHPGSIWCGEPVYEELIRQAG